ncbi:MAG: penicillin-binding protein 2 [Pyrinomonadaceae bacterium]|nr:penicillin-binding protein 2 [Pyrinomonadaceae bacterium]
MKLDDLSQNLPIRIGTIQIIAFVLLSVLGARLYYLQIVRNEHLRDLAERQRIRLIPIPAPRGAIFDRNGKLLVDSRSTYNIVLSHEPIKTINPADRLEDYAAGLGLDRNYLLERLNVIRTRPEFETMVIKENASQSDIVWVESHQLEFPELQVELQPQRNYPLGKTLSHVLGYVGEISPKQLEKPEFQEKGLRPGDIIGKGGLEQYYDDYLRGKEGYRKVLVDSRGRVQEELEKVPPQAGQDLVTTIDLDLQLAAEEQLEKSVTKRGMIIAMDPNNGEVLAMASAPSFDPNVFVKGSATPEGRKQIAQYYTDEQRPLLNRAIQGRYPPGSTWKIPESVAGLEQGVITVANSNVTCGGGITIGGKFTRCMGSHGAPPLSYAITKSCDGYYYRLGLKMGIDGLIKMIETFGYDKPSGIDLPNEKTPQTPKTFRSTIEKRYGGRWIDIETVYASIGQSTVVVTPISMIRAVASIGVQGKMYVPHFLKEFKEIGAVGDPNDGTYTEAKPAFGFQHPEPRMIPMTPEQNNLVLKGMWGVVNGGGTAGKIRIPGFDIAGKTGTAQVAALGQDKGKNRDHAWFVSFAPAYKPEIAVIGLIENSGFGGDNAAPAVRGVYTAYLAKRQPLPTDSQQPDSKK